MVSASCRQRSFLSYENQPCTLRHFPSVSMDSVHVSALCVAPPGGGLSLSTWRGLTLIDHESPFGTEHPLPSSTITVHVCQQCLLTSPPVAAGRAPLCPGVCPEGWPSPPGPDLHCPSDAHSEWAPRSVVMFVLNAAVGVGGSSCRNCHGNSSSSSNLVIDYQLLLYKSLI